jgi:thiol-disulfide isomerase/thioredoxin
MRNLVISCAILACVGCHQQQPSANQSAPAAESRPVKGPDRSHEGQPFPHVMISSPDGTQTSYAGFRGTPTLMNFWATWCAPCVKELPTLQKLAGARKDLHVVPVSQDSAPLASVKAFLAKTGAGDLGAYTDPKMEVGGALGVEVLPTTILFDADGKEVWRYVGDLDWTSPEAAKLLAEAGARPQG